MALRATVFGAVTARARARAGPAQPPRALRPGPFGDIGAASPQVFRSPSSTRARIGFGMPWKITPSGRQGRLNGRPSTQDCTPAETITSRRAETPAPRVHRCHRADRRPSLAWRAATRAYWSPLDGSAHAGPATTMSLPSLRWGRRVPRTPTPDRLHRAAAAAGRLGPRRAGRRWPKIRREIATALRTAAHRLEHHVEHRHRARLVERGVAVAALGRLHARRAAGPALAVDDRRRGWRVSQSRAAPRSRARRTRRRRGGRRGRRRSGGRCRVESVDTPPMSQRSQVANSGSSPIGQCSAACSGAGEARRGRPALEQRGVVDGLPDRAGAQRLRGQVERHGLQHLAVGRAPR